MKRSLQLLSILLALGFTTSVRAESAGKEITVEGKGCCAKCCLKQASECQNAITVEKDGKKTTYLLADNEVSKKFHENICKGIKPVKATGTCKKVGETLELTVSKIELAQ